MVNHGQINNKTTLIITNNPHSIQTRGTVTNKIAKLQSNEKRTNLETFIRRLADTNVTQWMNTGIILPRADYHMAVAYWNDTFYLFGMSIHCA